MSSRKVLVIGGRGYFGQLLVDDLLRNTDCELTALALVSWVGHDWGAVGVEVSGAARRRAYVIADSHAERIAVMPASVMAAMLVAGIPHRGLISYEGWMGREQLRAECENRGFRLVVEEA